MTYCSRKKGANEVRPGARARTGWSKTALRYLGTLGLAGILLGIVSAPASAHVRVFLGFGLPVYPYPYAYSYPPPPPPYYAYPPYAVYGPSVGFATPAPPVWVGGHWAWRHGPWGHRSRAWMPPHRHW